jgi:hypothetical protein
MFFRRRQERPITEATAYARCHGDRGREILSVKKRPPGETLREAFEAKIEGRH